MNEQNLEDSIVQRALDFAINAHEGQKREYTGEPYIVHPVAVASRVSEVEGCSSYMQAAALLHDVIEDCDVTLEEIRDNFGMVVELFVHQLTDYLTPADGDRAYRKECYIKQLENALPPVHTIKLADMIDNMISIIEHDPDFAKIYLREKREMLKVLKYGDKELYNEAKEIIDSYSGESDVT